MLSAYFAHQRKLSHLSHIQGLLQRDQEACMPSKAGEGRGEQIGLMASLRHEQSIDKEYATLVTDLYQHQDTFDERTKRSLKLAKEELDYASAVSTSFVSEFETIKSHAQQAWATARETNDFWLFAPHLEKVIAYTKRYTQMIQPGKDPYDTLLDLYEEGATKARYDTLLLPLQEPITKLVYAIPENKSPLHLLSTEYPQHILEQLLRELCETVGFDFLSGTFGVVHHPFMTTLGAFDYRINTRYTNPLEAITGMIHELGHGLYEQWNDPKLHYTNLHYGASTGMHESQSRTLENFIGRSKEFCNYLHGLFEKYFGIQAWTTEVLYQTLNNVRPSCIRIESDEVSYNLHILLRYQIEKEIFADTLAVKDIPSRRNELMQTYFGITPSTDSQGCLQDVHWSCGYFWYFPTYMLGNLYGAQLFQTCQTTHPNIMKNIEQGDFWHYFQWHKENIWTYGRSKTPHDIITQITGKELSSQYFLEYLQKKYI